MSNEHTTVSIIIDKKEQKSPNPTTGSALYALGGINPENYDLYEEVHGHGDDIHIVGGTQTINLKNGTHFYSVQKNINPGSSND
jgi:hypothetical protein